jgi:murein hydrolase activator
VNSGITLRGLGLALLIASPLIAAAADDRDEIEARLQSLRVQIDTIRERLDEELAERDQALDALASAEREVSRTERARRLTVAEIERLDARIQALGEEQLELQSTVAASARALGMQLVLAYRHGGQSRLKLLLNQDDPRQLNRHLAYHGYLSRARLKTIDELSAGLEDLARLQTELEIEREQYRMLARRQQSELEQLESARVLREQALVVVEGRIQTRQQELAALEQDAAELARLLDQLATALADIPPDIMAPSIADLRGQLPHPVRGTLRQRFGDHRTGDLSWNGWLIIAESGTEVRAVAHGRVAYSDWLRGYGLILIVDHGDGFMSLYAHNESLLRDVGDWVGPGEVIASVGNSGGVSEIGLYFELRRNGQPINPAAWLEN